MSFVAESFVADLSNAAPAVADPVWRLHGRPSPTDVRLPTRWRWWRHRDLRLVEQLPPALDHLVRQLRAGRTPREAIERVASKGNDAVHQRLHRVADGLRLGADPDRALEALCGPDDPRALARTAVVLRLALRDAGGAADAIAGLATSLRTDHTARARAEALTAQARLSVRTLTALPVLFVAFGVIAGTAQATTLLTTEVGRVCAVVGATLLTLGHWWMHRLVRRVTS